MLCSWGEDSKRLKVAKMSNRLDGQDPNNTPDTQYPNFPIPQNTYKGDTSTALTIARLMNHSKMPPDGLKSALERELWIENSQLSQEMSSQ